MTFLVPFDGSELAEAALVRATRFGAVLEERVPAVSVVPRGNADYARERGWIGPDEPFDVTAVVSGLHERVTELCPSADFRHEVVDRYAPAGTISRRIRRVAVDEGASMVFVGSENAGRLVTSLGSVGGTLASAGDYDVVIVRNPTPARIARLHEETDRRNSRSDFFLPE
ncbi:universal stress protein [Halorarum halophilum]|uniref:Universal stress protein n=1 Tax=Halorarum halophilum TaxID=2743090 RepID=A0A7D5KEH1_9EURY|nr:universal stress protein [Halobaculum halophilum]QLG26816.1 universal stress protein [Halobaculum halophilum]